MKSENIQAETVTNIRAEMNEDENRQKNQDASSIAEHIGNQP